MLKKEIPRALYGHIGGSGTWGCDFPEEVLFEGVKVLEGSLEFETPFGKTVPMKLLEIDGEYTADHNPKLILDVVFHGWNGLSPYNELWEERVFWVFQQAGVKFIIADGTVACINPLLEVGDVIVPSDFIDYTKRPYQISKFTKDILQMTDIICPNLKRILLKQAQEYFGHVFSNGTYGVYEAPRLESAAETNKFYHDHCDILGHTMMPEAALARAIGACYVPLYFVSSYAEGLHPHEFARVGDWEHCASYIGNTVLGTFAEIDEKRFNCSCAKKRITLPDDICKRIRMR